MSWEVGDTVVSEAKFKDVNKNAVDPDVLSFTFRRPGEVDETKWTYPSDPEIVKLATGIFYVEIVLNKASDESGDWICRWYGSGPTLGRVKQFRLRVAKTQLVTAP